MSRFFRNNSLTLVMFIIFFSVLIGQVLTGERVYNQEQEEHGAPQISLGQYLGSGHLIEGVFENWESEFLQMFSYIFLTIFLLQKGSAESKPLTGSAVNSVQKSSRSSWPVRRGGIWLKVYENSLGIVFLVLFIFSLLLHAYGGAQEACREESRHGGECNTMIEYMATSQFWYESFQNWQSEFLAVGALIVLSIFLRQKGSPESKPVGATDASTGSG